MQIVYRVLIAFIVFYTPSFLQAITTQEAFTNIYEQGIWGLNEHGVGHSGSGSTEANTRLYRFFLQDFMRENQIKTVVDVGCGDWEFSRLIDWSGIHYTGFDIVRSVVENNNRIFGNSHIQFFCGNLVELDLPSADLLICKDVLMHLPHHDILACIPQFAKFKHCLITYDVEQNSLSAVNHDCTPGGFRLLDLTQPPFYVKGRKILTFTVHGTSKQVLYIRNY